MEGERVKRGSQSKRRKKVCDSERKRGEKERKSENKGERESENVCVRVRMCMCVRERGSKPSKTHFTRQINIKRLEDKKYILTCFCLAVLENIYFF